MDTDTLKGLNIVFPIYNEDGTPFHNLVLRKSVVDSVVMSLGDKITGDVFYKDNTLPVTMREYIEYKQNPEDENEEPIRYSLVNPPTIVREGMVADNGELKGMTKYSFEFYHPMCQLSNFPFTDVATKAGEEKYLSQNKTFSWIGKPQDYIDKLNKNLQGTVWYVRKSDRFPIEKNNELSDVLTFDNVTVADAIKTGYETWDIPYVVSQLQSTDPLYAQGKRFVVEYGLPSNEIYESDSARQLDSPFVFHMGQGVGLKNNSRTPRNNKIVTRIAGYGSEDNVPYGYPQIVWTGNQDWDYTINNDPNNPLSYPIYKGIVGGQYVKLIKHPFTRTHLMPSIFTETVNKKVNPNAVGYDPTIEIKDYYDAVATQEYPYVNEINLQAPSYESHEFADIKPELDADRNTGIVSAVPLNADLTPADHWDDTMDDNGKYLQEYFKITLPQLSFDLYACAAITQEMQINMRSGACIGCTFPIQVDWDDYKRNFYDEDGNFVPDGEQRDLTKYPKSNLGQISVVVQKDNSTFGTLMPNIYQQPKSDDLFVFIGISLPTSYITNAEIRLDAAMKSYMLENNVYYFDYPLKFDEHFLATHTYILEQIRPNSIIHFDYGGVEQKLFVKQLTVKYGNAPLPQYDITLTDNVEVVLNQIGQVADDVEKLSSLIAILRQSYNRNVWIELAKKLSKVSDDTAQGFIRFVKGLQVGNMFTSGILGEGGVFRKDADGKTYIEADKMYIRMKAYFDSVEIREYQHTSGNRIASQAKGFTASRVEWLDSNGKVLEQKSKNLPSVVKFRCYWRAKDDEHEAENQFVVGDQAFMEYSDIVDGNLIQKRFWRVVVGRNVSLTDDGEAWIDLSNKASDTITYIDHQGTSRTKSVTGFEPNSSIPQPEDDICQLGNVWDTERQGAIIEYVSGGDAPSYQIFQGIDSFSLNGRNYIGLGYSSQKGRAYINVYGDAYIGDKPDAQGNAASYIRYNSTNKKLTIKADVDIQSTFGGKTFNEAIGGTTVIKDLQNQIDGAIESWFLNGAPVDKDGVLLPSHEPYATWLAKDTKTDEETGETIIVNTERLKHLGDLYYDNETGYAYRFANTSTDASPVFAWQRISDTDIVKALEAARKAQDTADGKRTIYSTWEAWVKSGVNTLEVGDLFIPQSTTTQGGVTYEANKVYKCTTKGSATFQEVAYTDDSAFNGYISAILNGSGSSGDAATVAAAQKAIKDALGGGTTVDGGLLLTSLIAMRKYKGSGSTTDIANYDTWAGISGLRKDTETGSGWKGYGIAAWYGGAMVDHEVSTTATDYAKSLFRFDGSGYLAGGNITWDKDGIVTIANVYSDVNGNPVPWSGATLQYITNLSTLLPITIQSGVTYLDPQVGFKQLSVLGETVATQAWVGNNYLSKTDAASTYLTKTDASNTYVSIAFFERLFKAYNGSTVVHPNSTSTIDNIKAMFGFWTQQYISALGQGSDGGATIQTLAQLNDVSISNVSDGQVLVYDSTSNKWKNGVGTGVDMTAVWAALAGSTNEQINASHLTTALSSYATTNQLNALEYLNQVIGGEGFVTLKTNKNTEFVVDFTHEHSWFEILDRPDTITGYGIILTADDIPSITKSKISDFPTTWAWSAISNKPTTVSGYGITDAYTKAQVDSLVRLKSVALASDGVLAFELQDGSMSYADLTHQHSFQEILDKPTTIAGYGITDAYTKSEVYTKTESDGRFITKEFFETLFNALDSSGVKVNANSTSGIASIKAMFGFWTEQYVSALGNSSDGGGGGQGDVTWALLAQQATNNRIIHQSYIADILSNYATTSWVTGLNYATQTWVEGKGYATTTQLNALEFLSAVTGGDGFVTLTTNKNNSTILDLSHEHSWFELLDRPDTLAGYGVTLTADDIPNIPKSKISDFPTSWAWSAITGKPTTVSGYGITDACTQSTANGLLYTMSLNNDGTINVITLGGTTKYSIDFTHQHSFFELVDRPTTIDGYSITGGKFVDDITFANTKGINLFNTANTAKKVMYLSSDNVLVIGSGTSESSYNTYLRGYSIYFKYGTSGSTGMYLSNGGNVGIGTTSPSYNLHVAGSIGGNSLSIANGGRINVQGETSGMLYIGNSNNAGWVRLQDICSQEGTAGDASGWSIRTSGNALFANVQSNGYVTALSDARHKTIINSTELQVEQIARMPAVVYRWNDGREDNGLHVGSIAQDWQRILPEVVTRANDKEGTLSMQYGVASLVSSIITARKVVDHEREIERLKKRVDDLEKENEQLKMMIA